MTEFRKFVRYSEIMVNEINERNNMVHFSMHTTYKNSKKEMIHITVRGINRFGYCGFKASRSVFDECSKQVQIVDSKEEVFDTKDFTISVFEVMMKKVLAGDYGDYVMRYKE